MAKATSSKGRAARSRASSSMKHPSYLPVVDEVRARQIKEGNFDCFGRAASGYCDQGRCLYRQECLEISRKLDA